jgi:hypothetical protein
VSSACGEFGLYAETPSVAIYLLSCSAGPLVPTPSVTIAVGSIVRVSGSSAGSEGLALPQHQDVALLAGETITGLKAGTVIVTATGVDCATVTSASQPEPCPLFIVRVR